MPEGGLNIRLQDTFLGQEARLHDFKRDAMLAFVRANKLNHNITSGGRNAKIGIITVGKSYLDVREALDELGIDEVGCNERSLIEVQVREELYGTANQPVCIGKKDEHGNWLFPVKGALDPNDIAICIGERLLARGHNEELAAKIFCPASVGPGLRRQTMYVKTPAAPGRYRLAFQGECFDLEGEVRLLFDRDVAVAALRAVPHRADDVAGALDVLDPAALEDLRVAV